jgi:lantibiotic transport system permease protein
MISFANTYRAETIKTKNTFAAWLTLSGAIFIPLMMMIAYLVSPESFIPPPEATAWQILSALCFGIASSLFIPLYVVLVTSLMLNFEHRSHAWKHIFVQPASKSKIYFSKLAVILQTILACYLFFVVFQLLLGVIAGATNKSLGFYDAAPDWGNLFSMTFKSFVSTLGITMIHFWLSLRVKNMIVPIAVGLVSVVVSGVLVNHWEHVAYFPYAAPLLSAMEQDTMHFFFDYHYVSLAYFVVFGVLSYFDFTRFFKG